MVFGKRSGEATAGSVFACEQNLSEYLFATASRLEE
jgi:hypothetical protein